MIRYPFNRANVEADIAALDPKWLEKAARRTNKFLELGRYEEKTTIWSAVKPVYMRLQHNKCVFCERKLETETYGKIEHDLEHFRPKSSVLAWPDPNRHPGVRFPYGTGDDAPAGYYWLAYDLENYAAACKVCNTSFKLNYFPIAGFRATPTTVLAEEMPLLCYPLGELDADPQSLVTFTATTAVPAAQDGHDRRRGEIIIEFFGLNKRENLHFERAEIISAFGGGLLAARNNLINQTQKQIIDEAKSSFFPHAGCLRAFLKLWLDDQPLAVQVYQSCFKYMWSQRAPIPRP
jgi:hypothetical protein